MVEKGTVALPALLRELVVKPLLCLERGFKVHLAGQTYTLCGTLVSLVADHIGHVELLAMTGVKSKLASKYNLIPKSEITNQVANNLHSAFQRNGFKARNAVDMAKSLEWINENIHHSVQPANNSYDKLSPASLAELKKQGLVNMVHQSSIITLIFNEIIF